MRIASLLPSATEISCLLGLSGSLVGVSHECDYPAAVVRDLPRLTRSAIPPNLGAAEIDAEVSARLRRGESLYLLEDELLERLAPDLLITQELCDVCAVSYGDVCVLAERLPNTPRVVSLAPPDLNGIWTDIASIAAATGRVAYGTRVIGELKQRLARGQDAIAGRPPVPVVALEWLDPPFAAGHWVPEMIALAGGRELLGRAGERSFRLSWQQVIDAQPEVVLLIPCGYDAAAAQREWDALPKPGGWESIPAARNRRVYALDANSYCSRPGPRVVEGVEYLARLLHPATV